MKPTQEELGRFVSREVFTCQTMLVDQLLNTEAMNYQGFDFENITNLYENTSFENWQEVQGETYLKHNTEEQQLKDYEDREENPQEIFEWWVVSDWLLEKLEDKGQPVLKTDFGSWWGRTCTGQAILLDSVIEEIYTDLHKI